MPTYNLRCDRCDYSVSNMILWGAYLYRDEAVDFTCHRTMGWCDDCRELTPIEDFDQIDFDIQEIESRAKWLAGESVSVWKNLLRVFFKSRRVHLASFADDIIAATKTIKLSRKRIGSERCLLCGGNCVRAFDGDVDVKMSSGLTYKGQNNTGFLHPGCEGEFIAEGSNMRFSVRLRTRIYSPDGDKIEEYYE
jgi:hypothetical protein